MSRDPFTKRYHKGECTNCGRPRGNNELWCDGCIERARRRGQRNPQRPRVTPEYVRALEEAYGGG